MDVLCGVLGDAKWVGVVLLSGEVTYVDIQIAEEACE